MTEHQDMPVIAPQQLPGDVLDMARRLVDALDPERIYLFGSAARGDMTRDSDYDFMVIVEQSNIPTYRLSQQAHRALSDFAHAKDVLVWTREEFEGRTHLAASLPATILREGVLLYER